MATVQPGELRYLVTINNIRRTRDANDHYIVMPEVIQARAGIMKGSGTNKLEDGAARAVDTVTFIVRWEVRKRIQRDASLRYCGTDYAVDWMDPAPWAGRYARVKCVSKDAPLR